MPKKMEYYSLRRILEKKCQYNIIIGERSNGKTYATLEYGLKNYIRSKGKEKFAVLRRWREDIVGKRGASIFAPFQEHVLGMTNGAWDKIIYRTRGWYFAKYDLVTDKLVPATEPFAYAFALNEMEHDKSTSYPDVTTIIFDEFLTRGFYLADEFVVFMNALSTIIRDRDNVKIFMLGNTVNKYAPYFKEMGLTNIPKMQPGDIDLYSYGENKSLHVAVELCGNTVKKKSNVYFAFSNPKLHMIKSGKWELDFYPHLTAKYKPRNILLSFFIMFDGELLQGDVVALHQSIFAFIHRKTTPIKNPEKDIIYTKEDSFLPNWSNSLMNKSNVVFSRIAFLFANNKVFYQDNEVGEIVANFQQN